MHPIFMATIMRQREADRLHAAEAERLRRIALTARVRRYRVRRGTSAPRGRLRARFARG